MSVSSGFIVYVFYVLVAILSFHLIVQTHEKVSSCVKNSPSFFLFVFPSLFSSCFSGHQRDDRVLICHSKNCPTVCQHCRRPPNCLPTFPKMAQLSANIAQLFAINVTHQPTVCQLCRPTNCLPTSCHSDHQIKSIRFLFGFIFFLP